MWRYTHKLLVYWTVLYSQFRKIDEVTCRVTIGSLTTLRPPSNAWRFGGKPQTTAPSADLWLVGIGMAELVGHTQSGIHQCDAVI